MHRKTWNHVSNLEVLLLCAALASGLVACRTNGANEATNGNGTLTDGEEAPSGSEEKLADSDILEAVERELLYDLMIPMDDLQMGVSMGVVTLAGTVPNLLAQERALMLAESVKGVRSVSSTLEVTPQVREDSAIQGDISQQIASDEAVMPGTIQVSVEEGVATLTGSVGSWVEKQSAERHAKSVRGVRSITNRIAIVYAAARSDDEIKADVVKRLSWDAALDQDLLNVSVDGGVVTLTGFVGSAAERRRAMSDAWVNGVTDVNDGGISVKWWAKDADKRATKYPEKTEEEITEAIRWAMTLNPRVSLPSVQPQVQGSTVTLTGNVTSLEAKNAAEQIARYTVGVTAVRNDIQVNVPKPLEDAAIQAAIEMSLVRNVITEAYEITTTVKDGVATLTGTVDNLAERAEATAVASRMPGVTKVDNQLSVKSTQVYFFDPYLYPTTPIVESWADYAPTETTKSDSEIRSDIKTELLWSPFVNSDEITVNVLEGKATLSGTVDSWLQSESAVENAIQGGAIAVENNLKIGEN